MTKLPEYQDFQAPWEKKGSEVDPEKAKRFLYTLLKQNEGLEAQVATVTTERDEFKSKVDEIARKDETEVERLKRENEELKTRKPEAGDSPEVLKLRIALDKKLTPSQMKRLVGNTKEELEADADELLASWGSNGSSNNDGEEEHEKPGSRRTPQQLNNGGDPLNGEPADLSWDKVADQIPRV